MGHSERADVSGRLDARKAARRQACRQDILTRSALAMALFVIGADRRAQASAQLVAVDRVVRAAAAAVVRVIHPGRLQLAADLNDALARRAVFAAQVQARTGILGCRVRGIFG